MIPEPSSRTAVVFGARHLGRGISARLSFDGWRVVAAARTEATIDSLASEYPDVIGRAVDLGAPGAAAETRSPTRGSPPRRSRGNARRARTSSRRSAARSRPCTTSSTPRFGCCARRDTAASSKITGGLALRALAGTGPLAATGYVTRALIEGAVPEAREDGVHLALLVIRGMIESELTAASLEGKPQRAAMTDDDVQAAIEFLYSQGSGRA